MYSRMTAVGRLIVIDLLGSMAWFPVWWYSVGLAMVLRKIRQALRYRVRQYGFSIWISNFFVPMYGQYTLTGRAVSIFMRCVVLVGRAIALVVEAGIYGVGAGIWLVAPVALTILFFSNVYIRIFLSGV